MRNEPIHAYSLHQRPFQDKRTIYYLLTQEYGVMHGISKKGVPQFVPLTMFATGKKSLKTLQQVTIAETVPSLIGQQQYAALYVNEITLKLLPVEDSMPIVYEQYRLTITQLQQPLSLDELKLVLRAYEHVLFSELGHAIDLYQDNEQNDIDSTAWYAFIADSGWKLLNEDELKVYTPEVEGVQSKRSGDFMGVKSISGQEILEMRSGINERTVNSWSLIHRLLVDHLFDYKPLQSRILWQQFHRYQ